jgi:hypothetical protein
MWRDFAQPPAAAGSSAAACSAAAGGENTIQAKAKNAAPAAGASV